METQRRIIVQYLSTGQRPVPALPGFLALWAINSLALCVAGLLFPGAVSFRGAAAIAVSGLLLSLANAVIRPIMLFLTIPITIVTFGLFILVINGLVLLLVAGLMPGFALGGFWAAVGIAMFVSLFRFVITRLLAG